MKKGKKELDVLFVDDEADNLDAFVFNCEEFWNTHTVMDPISIMERKYSVEKHDAIMVDLVYGYPVDLQSKEPIDPQKGLMLLDWLQENYPTKPVMVLSAYLSNEVRERIGTKHPHVMCMKKPLDFSRSEFRNLMENYIRDFKGPRKAT